MLIPRKRRKKVFLTAGIDPGKNDTWCSIFVGHMLVASGPLYPPGGVEDYLSDKWILEVKAKLRSVFHEWLEYVDRIEIVIERYQHRAGGFGGTMSEVMNIQIGVLIKALQEIRCVDRIFLTAPSTHKTSRDKHHTEMYPIKMMDQIAIKHGTWRPRKKVLEPCEHIRDAMSVAIHRILKREDRF